MTTAAIYTRLSKDRLGDGLGVERQEADCRALAARLGLDVAAAYSDNDVSASTRSRKPRPRYAAMIEAARRGEITTIIAYSNSRLTRRPLETEDLIALAESRGTRFHTVVSGQYDLGTADGRAMARTLAAWDAAEAERVSERGRRQKLQAAEAGRWRGGPRPFGYEPGGMQVREAEARWVRTAAELIVAGRSLRSVCAMLDEAGVPTSTGQTWAPVSLKRMLLRPRNAGLVEHRGETVGPALWPPLLSEDLWRAAVGILTAPNRRTNATNPGLQRTYLGSGIYLCGKCNDGTTMRLVHQNPNPRYGQPRPVAYACKAARHLTVEQPAADEFVRGVVAARLARPDFADLLPVGNRDEATTLNVEAQALRERLVQVERDYDDGLIDGRRMAAATAATEAKLSAVGARLSALHESARLGSLLRHRSPAEAFLSADVESQAVVLAALCEVIVQPVGRGRPKGGGGFNPDRLRIAWR